jgi:Holliday junction resolvasome RuvABC endonuclease subunit
MKKLYIGIDPGSASGCIAILREEWLDHEIFTCSTIEFSKYTTKEWYDEFKRLRGVLDTSISCVLEKVHGMPGMGVQSITAFMKNVGHIEMALISLNIPCREVTPQTWMKYYNLKKEKDESKTDWKRRLREHLQRIMPTITVTNDTADAILIAYYAYKIDR